MWTVYCSAGNLGNSTIIEGDDGLIVYDTGVNLESGSIIAAEIAKISDKPVKAIFYSHHHTGHYNGTKAIVDQDDVDSGAVRIYAWENFLEERANEFGDILPVSRWGPRIIFYTGGEAISEFGIHVPGYDMVIIAD